MSKDYYKILGVPRDADDNEIKKAYRKLAHKYHPDKKGGNENKFKEINEAYQVLSDRRKRAQYDQFGADFEQTGSEGFGGFDFSGFSDIFKGKASGIKFEFGGDSDEEFGDIFSGLFGGAGEKNKRRGNDVSVDIGVTLEEIAAGAEKEIDIYVSSVCPNCKGSGAEKGFDIKPCETCKGKGKIKKEKRTMLGVFSQIETCYDCQGQGEKPSKNCSRCGGDGKIKDSKIIKVRIPAGISDNQTIKLSGQGEVGFRPSAGKSIPGDLYITVHEESHQLFTRKGDDIYYKLNISFSQAVLGDKVEIPTLQGKVKLKIPSGTQSGRIIRLKGKGIPHLQGWGKGDMFVVVQITVPEKLSRKQKQLIEEFRKEGI